MTTVMRVRTETRAKRRRAPSVVPLVVGVVIVRPVVVIPLVVVILSDRCRLRRHDPGLVTAAALRVLPGAAVRSVRVGPRSAGRSSAGRGSGRVGGGRVGGGVAQDHGTVVGRCRR